MAEEVVYVSLFTILTFKLWSDLGTNSNGIESLVIEIINKKSKNAVFSAHYRQPAGDFKQ